MAVWIARLCNSEFIPAFKLFFTYFLSGIDCDQVFSNIILGNGATVKKKDYLKRIGITHILNSAEYRGVNVGNDYFNKMGDNFQYFGIRIEDTPQTQICK